MTDKTQRLESIDWLRGVAAVTVLFHHLYQQFFVTTLHGPAADILSWFGPWGVGLFFVLSGFCIRLPQAKALAEDANAKLPLRDYALQRAIRIAPPYYMAILASLLVGQIGRTALLDGRGGLANVGLHVLFLQTLWPLDGWSISAVFWTIALEVHFYVAYLLFANRRASLKTLAVLFSVGLVVFALVSSLLKAPNPWRLIGQYVFIVDFWQWYMGVWVADWFVKHRPTLARGPLWAGRAALATLSLALGLADPTIHGFHYFGWLLPIANAGVIAAFVVRPADGRTAHIRPLRFLGEISYSLYLLHPLGLALGLFCLQRGLLRPLPAAAVSMATGLILATLNYRLVEWPLLKWRARLKHRHAADSPDGPLQTTAV